MSTELNETAIRDDLIAAAGELASYTSYAEIIGAIRHNQAPIRKWCDEVLRLNRELQKIRDDEEDALTAAEAK